MTVNLLTDAWKNEAKSLIKNGSLVVTGRCFLDLRSCMKVGMWDLLLLTTPKIVLVREESWLYNGRR
ncbi:uncharacterized protein PHALS_06913 [Plasmopara halstedii]|uniref:Uncharacterized protein n=1 Tax=Plasmopara halstedii TaxID=4781 RepID=A0A0P1B300_PLAHL|nr:uncharacterized protein PHALS_06913 [Plasmopara halstedii]CEG49133.1 hypothetical protein PHALS_06913 [Plasmopara halstedii]|eukprot:XP_024585502.1 hypothetical protein PHALS_06913 [Plasmopara halstedii]